MPKYTLLTYDDPVHLVRDGGLDEVGNLAAGLSEARHSACEVEIRLAADLGERR
jgi:hypothetical protein